MKGGPSEKSDKSEESLTYCWPCDTPGHLGRPCSSIYKDPDFRLVKSNILYPHKRKKHLQEMLREVKEQMNHEVKTMLDNRLTATNNGLKDGKQTPDIPNETLNPKYQTPTISLPPSDQIYLTLDHQSQPTGSKDSNGVNEDDQTVIDLTDKVDKDHPMKHHDRLPRESCINFSGTINTDTRTIEGHYNATSSMVLGAPKVINSSPLDELNNRLNEQARLLSQQQKAIQGIQHSQNQVPKTQSNPFSHQALPYDPSIPPPKLVSTPQRMNELDGERTVQVDGPPDIPQTEHTRPDQKQNKYSERYYDDYPSHLDNDQDFGYDDKACMKREPMLPYQSDSIKNDDNSNLLDDTLTQLLQNRNDIQQKTCELLSTLSNKPPGTEFMHDILTDVTVYDRKKYTT